MAQFTLVPRRTKKLKRIVPGEFNLETALPDISLLGDTIQKISASIIREEIAKGNPPSNIIVDNMDAKPFNDADFRILTLFSDTDRIAYAALTAITELKKNTRVLTGKALNSFQIWTTKSFTDGGRLEYIGDPTISQLKAFASKVTGPKGRLVIAGPMVKYGRKLYWNPISEDKKGKERKLKGRKRRFAVYDAETGTVGMRSASSITGNASSTPVRSTRNTNMRDLAVPRIKRRHPDVIVVGRWIRSKAVGKLKDNNRWPGIGIGLRQKGRVN